jgi:hypothetical protein
MKTFQKQEANINFDHQAEVRKMFSDLGYSNVKIETSLINGISHYVRFEVLVLNENKLFHDMDVWGDYTDIEVRVSDHASNLNKFGNAKNKMTMNSLLKLRETGAISLSN